MSAQLVDVAYWVMEWEATREIIPESVARRIAEYWHGEDGALAAFARGEYVDGDELRDDIWGTICYAKSAAIFGATIHELYALEDWVLYRKAMSA